MPVISFILSFIIGMLFAEPFIKILRRWQKSGQPIRHDGPKQHLISKAGMPTMGGVLILSSALAGVLLCCNLLDPYVYITVLFVICYAFIGFLDDILKISKSNSKGLSGKKKLAMQFIFAFAAVWQISDFHTNYGIVYLPIIDVYLNLGSYYMIFACLVLVGASNAVNLTDGLDGLATTQVIVTLTAFILLMLTDENYQEYLPLITLCAAFIGSLMAFLWFNAYPAKVIMGDFGSLALGGLLGIVSILTNAEIFLGISGIIFVVEAVSVIIQVISFKTTGKRIFKMSPIHHHFEQSGWAEPTIVLRFLIIGSVFSTLALAVYN